MSSATLTISAPHEQIVITPRVRGYSVRRYYDPVTGQFISVDPLVDQTDSPYGYAGQDPVNNYDLNGEARCRKFGSFWGTAQWIMVPVACAVADAFGGSSHLTPDQILKDPTILAGKSPWEIQQRLGKLPLNWVEGTLGKGSHKGLGYVLREVAPNGNLTGALIRWHPGGGHHGLRSYWVVADTNRGKRYIWGP